MNRITDRCEEHFLSATSFADGKNTLKFLSLFSGYFCFTPKLTQKVNITKKPECMSVSLSAHSDRASQKMLDVMTSDCYTSAVGKL